MKSSGEFTVPCCKPFSIKNYLLDVCEPSVITKNLLVIMFQTILIRYFGKLFLTILYIRPKIHIMLNAFTRSIKQAATHCFALRAQQMFDINLFIAWSVECLCRKPNIFSGITWFFVRKETRGLFMTISNNLLMLSKGLIGRRFEGKKSFLSLFVMAINLPFFHFLGKYALFSGLLSV